MGWIIGEDFSNDLCRIGRPDSRGQSQRKAQSRGWAQNIAGLREGRNPVHRDDLECRTPGSIQGQFDRVPPLRPCAVEKGKFVENGIAQDLRRLLGLDPTVGWHGILQSRQGNFSSHRIFDPRQKLASQTKGRRNDPARIATVDPLTQDLHL